MEKKITYLNEYHKKNSGAAMKYIAESKRRKIDWYKELERLKHNSKDHSLAEKLGIEIEISPI